jgi:replication factor C subunit 2/4
MSARTQLWVEKFRPKDLTELSSQEEVKKTLLGAIEQGQLPHLLMYGPPGTGKTSTILALARTLYHPSVLKDRVLEMNASDERGIKIVRDKIKNFASHSVSTQKFEGYKMPPFKIIILDECDSMTKDAQGALRRTMEVYSSTTRFCLICNYVSRIIEPLVSRCAKLRFTPLSRDAMKKRLLEIAEIQACDYSATIYEHILDRSCGDMRRAVTLLQSCHTFYGEGQTPNVDELSGGVPVALIEPLWVAVKANDLTEMGRLIDNLTLEGYSAATCFSELHDIVLRDDAVTDAQKACFFEALAHADKCLADGANDHLQLQTVCAVLCH